jgi:hypothetical protein
MRSAIRSLHREYLGDEQLIGLSPGQQQGLEVLPLLLVGLRMFCRSHRIAVRVLGERSRYDIRCRRVTPRNPVTTAVARA